jgi:hypothetical protein
VLFGRRGGGGEQPNIALSTHLGEPHSLHGNENHKDSPFGNKREEVGWIALAHLDRVLGIVDTIVNSSKLAHLNLVRLVKG